MPKKFGTGGSASITYGGQGQINKQRTRFGSQFGNKLNVPNESLNKYEGKSAGGAIGRPDLQKVNKPKTSHGKSALFKEGGTVKQNKLKSMFKGKETYAEELKEAKAIKSGKITPQEYAKGEKMEGHKKGGRIAAKGEHSVQKQSKRGAEVVKMARGGGIEVRGKTKGTMVKMCSGGMSRKK